MPRPYAPRDVFRQLSPDLIRRYLDRESIDLAVGQDAFDDADALYDAWATLPSMTRDRVEEMLRGVHDLATPNGVRLVFDEAAFQHRPLGDTFDLLSGLHDKALWAYLRQPVVFAQVLRVVRADQLPGRYWRTATGLPNITLHDPNAAAAALALGLRHYFHLNQGRGQRVTPEYYLRGGTDHYFFCYTDDYSQTHAAHGPHGRLERRPLRPVFDVVFVYAPATGTLELYAPGDRRVRAALEEVFCREVLDCDPPPPRRRGDPRFELNPILRHDFQFPTDPEDGVTSVRVRRVRLALPEAGERVLFETDTPLLPAEVRCRLDRLLDPSVPRDRLNVTFATFVLTYSPRGGGRDKVLTFDVGYPDSCSLKNLPEEQRLLGERCLRRWGLARD